MMRELQPQAGDLLPKPGPTFCGSYPACYLAAL